MSPLIGCLLSKVFLSQMSSSIIGCLPSKVAFLQRSSKADLKSKVIFHQRPFFIKGRLPLIVVFHWRSSSIKFSPCGKFQTNRVLPSCRLWCGSHCWCSSSFFDRGKIKSTPCPRSLTKINNKIKQARAELGQALVQLLVRVEAYVVLESWSCSQS